MSNPLLSASEQAHINSVRSHHHTSLDSTVSTLSALPSFGLSSSAESAELKCFGRWGVSSTESQERRLNQGS